MSFDFIFIEFIQMRKEEKTKNIKKYTKKKENRKNTPSSYLRQWMYKYYRKKDRVEVKKMYDNKKTKKRILGLLKNIFMELFDEQVVAMGR